MMDTLFLTLQLWNLLLMLSFSTRKHTSMASRAILSFFFFFRRTVNSKPPTIPFGLSHALYRTTFLEIAVFTYVSVLSSSLFYLFTSSTVRIPVHTAPQGDTEPIRYVKLHFRDQRDAASLRYGNYAEITALTCEEKPYPVWFSCQSKIYRVSLDSAHVKYDV